MRLKDFYFSFCAFIFANFAPCKKAYLKSFRTIFFVSCLIGPYTGIFFYLRFEKNQIRKEIRAQLIDGLDKSQLVKLVFSDDEMTREVEWEHDDEFEYRGEMYDVIESAVEDGQHIFWCWWDHEETALNKKLDRMLVDFLGSSNRPPDKNPIAGFMSAVYPMPPGLLLMFPEQSVNTPFVFYPEPSSVLSVFPDSPPPQV